MKGGLLCHKSSRLQHLAFGREKNPDVVTFLHAGTLASRLGCLYFNTVQARTVSWNHHPTAACVRVTGRVVLSIHSFVPHLLRFSSQAMAASTVEHRLSAASIFLAG